MPQSFNYPVSPIFLDDYIIGTSSNNENVTRNFRVGDVAAAMIGATGVGTVTSISTVASSFINVTGGIITTTGDISMALSATGLKATDAEKKLQFLRGDGTWSISGLEPTDIAIRNAGAPLTSTVSSIDFTGNVRLNGTPNGFITVEVLTGDGIVESVTAGNGIAPIIVTAGVATITNSGVLKVRAGGNVTLSGGTGDVTGRTGDVTVSTISNAGTVVGVLNGTGLTLTPNSSSNPELDLTYTTATNYLISSVSSQVITQNDFINYNKISNSTVKSTKLRNIGADPLTLIKTGIDQGDLNKIHNNEPAGFNETPKTNNIVACTSTDYAGINPKDINTLYFILDTSVSFTVNLDLNTNNQITVVNNATYSLSSKINGTTSSFITGVEGTPYSFQVNIATSDTYSGPNIPLPITGFIPAQNTTLTPTLTGTVTAASGTGVSVSIRFNLDYPLNNPNKSYAVTQLLENSSGDAIDPRETLRPTSGFATILDPPGYFSYAYQPKIVLKTNTVDGRLNTDTWRFYRGFSFWILDGTEINYPGLGPEYAPTFSQSGAITIFNYEEWSENWGAASYPRLNTNGFRENLPAPGQYSFWSPEMSIKYKVEPIPYQTSVTIIDQTTVTLANGDPVDTENLPSYNWEIFTATPDNETIGMVAQRATTTLQIKKLNNIVTLTQEDFGVPRSSYSVLEPLKPVFFTKQGFEGLYTWPANLVFKDVNNNIITWPVGGVINSANGALTIKISGNIIYYPVAPLGSIKLEYDISNLTFNPTSPAEMSPTVDNLDFEPGNGELFINGAPVGSAYRIPTSPNTFVFANPTTDTLGSGGFHFTGQTGSNYGGRPLTNFTATDNIAPDGQGFFTGTIPDTSVTTVTATTPLLSPSITMNTDNINVTVTLGGGTAGTTQFGVVTKNYYGWSYDPTGGNSNAEMEYWSYKYKLSVGNSFPTTNTVSDFWIGPPGTQQLKLFTTRSGTTLAAGSIQYIHKRLGGVVSDETVNFEKGVALNSISQSIMNVINEDSIEVNILEGVYVPVQSAQFNTLFQTNSNQGLLTGLKVTWTGAIVQTFALDTGGASQQNYIVTPPSGNTTSNTNGIVRVQVFLDNSAWPPPNRRWAWKVIDLATSTELHYATCNRSTPPYCFTGGGINGSGVWSYDIEVPEVNSGYQVITSYDLI